MKKIPLFLMLVVLVTAPLRVSAMEYREEKKGDDASDRDDTEKNSTTAAAEANKKEAARPAGTGFADDDSYQNTVGAPEDNNNFPSAAAGQNKLGFGAQDKVRDEIDLNPESLFQKSEDARTYAENAEEILKLTRQQITAASVLSASNREVMENKALEAFHYWKGEYDSYCPFLEPDIKRSSAIEAASDEDEDAFLEREAYHLRPFTEDEIQSAGVAEREQYKRIEEYTTASYQALQAADHLHHFLKTLAPADTTRVGAALLPPTTPSQERKKSNDSSSTAETTPGSISVSSGISPETSLQEDKNVSTLDAHKKAMRTSSLTSSTASEHTVSPGTSPEAAGNVFQHSKDFFERTHALGAALTRVEEESFDQDGEWTTVKRGKEKRNQARNDQVSNKFNFTNFEKATQKEEEKSAPGSPQKASSEAALTRAENSSSIKKATASDGLAPFQGTQAENESAKAPLTRAEKIAEARARVERLIQERDVAWQNSRAAHKSLQEVNRLNSWSKERRAERRVKASNYGEVIHLNLVRSIQKLERLTGKVEKKYTDKKGYNAAGREFYSRRGLEDAFWFEHKTLINLVKSLNERVLLTQQDIETQNSKISKALLWTSSSDIAKRDLAIAEHRTARRKLKAAQQELEGFVAEQGGDKKLAEAKEKLCALEKAEWEARENAKAQVEWAYWKRLNERALEEKKEKAAALGMTLSSYEEKVAAEKAVARRAEEAREDARRDARRAEQFGYKPTNHYNWNTSYSPGVPVYSGRW